MNRQLQLNLPETEGERKERIKESKLTIELILWIIGMGGSFIGILVSVGVSFVYGLVTRTPYEMPNSACISALVFAIIITAYMFRIPFKH